MTPEDENPIPESIRDNPLMKLAWRDCLMWATENPHIKAAFLADTGISAENANRDDWEFRERRSVEFVRWFNANVWGKT